MSEIPDRIRAARGYADMNQDELGEAIGRSGGTIKNREAGKTPTPWPELLAIADKCGVPRWFMEHGWDGWRKALTPEELRQIADALPRDDAPDD